MFRFAKNKIKILKFKNFFNLMKNIASYESRELSHKGIKQNHAQKELYAIK